MEAAERERAVKAIMQRNKLQRNISQIQQTGKEIQAEASAAIAEGLIDRERQLLLKSDLCRQDLTNAQAALQSTTETIESIKQEARREEAEIRRKNADAIGRHRGGGPGSAAA